MYVPVEEETDKSSNQQLLVYESLQDAFFVHYSDEKHQYLKCLNPISVPFRRILEQPRQLGFQN